MKYAIISDVHSNELALKLAIKDALEEKVDKFIFLGDYITDGYQDNEVLELVKKYGNYVIKGNREEYILDIANHNKKYNHIINEKPLFTTRELLNNESLTYIRNMKEYIITEIDGFKVLMVHGKFPQFLQPQNTQILDQLISHYEFDLCISGHTHTVENFIYKNHHFINPGSIGQPTDDPNYKYMILEIKDKKITTYLKLFPVSDTYQHLEEEYCKSKYYLENKIYGDLTLASIKTGKNKTEHFMETYRELVEENPNQNSEEIWYKLYETWKKKEIEMLESQNNL